MQTRIKLVVAINDFRIGGGQRMVLEMLKNMDSSVFEIYLITLMQFDHEPSFFDDVPKSVVVHRLSFRSFFDIREYRRLRKILSEIRPDVVWSSLFLSNTVFRLLKPLFGYAVIITEQNIYLWKNLFHRITDKVLSHMTYKIVAVSETVARFTAAQEKIPKEKFVVIHNGVDITRIAARAAEVDRDTLRSELDLETSDIVFINVGQFIEQKNQLLLLRAVAQAAKAHPRIRLLVLGDGKLRPELERFIEEHKLKKVVQLLGIQSDIARFYAISDAFIMTSRFEGLSLAAVEAMACGLPIITTHVSGADEYLEEGENGYFIAEDEHMIADILVRCADADQALLRDMGSRSRIVAARYDSAVATRAYEVLFKSAHASR